MRALWCLIGLVALSCTGTPDRLRQDTADSLAAAISSAGDGDWIELSDHIDVEYEAVTVFPPYQTNEVARDTLGFDWDIEGTGSTQSEGVNIVVFVRERSVAAWFKAQYDTVDFRVDDRPTTLPAQDATVQVVLEGFGHKSLALPCASAVPPPWNCTAEVMRR